MAIAHHVDYLSCSQAAKAIGVSLSTLQRYCDRGIFRFHRTLGGHRRIHAEDVANWLKGKRSRKRRRHRTKPFRATKFDATYIADALLDGRLNRLEPLLNHVLVSQNLTWLFDEFLAPAMWEIGSRWSGNQIEYADERRATTNLKQLLRTLGRSFDMQQGAPIAIGGSLEGDHAEIGSMMLELILRENKRDAFHIGSNLPPETVAKIAEQMQAKLVWISYCHIECNQKAIQQNHKLFRLLDGRCQLVIGGTALQSSLVAELKFDYFGQTLADFCRFLNQDNSTHESVDCNG